MPDSPDPGQAAANLDWFNESYKSIVQSNNLLLVTNGVVLGAFITVMSVIIAPADPSIFDYSFVNDLGSFFVDVPLIPFRLMLIAFGIVLPILISSGLSIGSINSGLYPRYGPRKPIEEFVLREKKALKWYSFASIFFSVAVIDIFALFTSFVIGLYSFWILVGSQGIFLALVLTRRLFRDYGDLSNSVASPVDNNPLPKDPVIHLYHHFGPLTIHSSGEDTEETNET